MAVVPVAETTHGIPSSRLTIAACENSGVHDGSVIDVITIDGTTGEIWLGAAAEGAAVGPEEEVLAHDLPELQVLTRRQ